MLIDTHIHLNDEAYEHDLEDVITRATKMNVGLMIVAGIDEESSRKAIAIASRYEHIYAAVGVHPSNANKMDYSLVWLEELLKHPKVIAIGEIGLDYYWDTSFKDSQITLFTRHLQLAKQYALPVIVHSRDAIQDTYDAMRKIKVDGIMHCYSSSVEMAMKFVELGYYIGIGGVVTFKNARILKEVVKSVPLTSIVTETDGPYLAPNPFRGKRNEPAYVSYVVDAIATILEKEPIEVELQVEENTKTLFRWRDSI